jgi:hypothetical protein
MHKERMKKGKYDRFLSVSTYESRKMKPVEIVLRNGGGRLMENNGGEESFF